MSRFIRFATVSPLCHRCPTEDRGERDLPGSNLVVTQLARPHTQRCVELRLQNHHTTPGLL